MRLSVLLSTRLVIVAALLALKPAFAETAKLQTVTLKFPQLSVGTVLLVPAASEGRQYASKTVKTVGDAKGEVKVPLTSDEHIVLRLNGSAIFKPEQLDQVNPDHIDRIAFQNLAMDEEQLNQSNNVLKHIARFKDVSYVAVARSDANDEGLGYISKMPKLKCISAFWTPTQGSFLSKFADSKLEILDLSTCPVTKAGLINVSKLKQMHHLSLSHCNLNSDDVKLLAPCTSLRDLGLSRNSKIDDSVIPCLQKLTNLVSLDVSETKISMTGLQKLNKLALLFLTLPAPSYSAEEMKLLKTAFPKARISVRHASINEETKTFFQPFNKE